MKITFLGTGAADWNWRDFPAGTRGSTSTLLGASCLIDAGASILRNLKNAHVSAARLTDLLITHGHNDHFHPESIQTIAAATHGRLRIWASPQVIARLPEGIAELHAVSIGDTFRAAGCTVTVLPSNHATADLAEQTLHYLFIGRGVRLLYALDGAWFHTKERLLLKGALGGKALTAVIWDATCGATYHDWRFAEHNDLKMVDDLRVSMLRDGLVAPETHHVFDHVARTLWPKTPAAQRRLAERHDGTLAEDGMVWTV